MPLDVQCTYAGQHGERWQRKQTHAVAGLRVKLHGNTISSSSDASPLSVCPVYPYSLPSLSLSPSIPLYLLAAACWLKKKLAWPQVNPSAYLSDPSKGTSPPAATNTHIGILLTAADKPTCNIKASWCNPWPYCLREAVMDENSKLIRKNISGESWSWEIHKA